MKKLTPLALIGLILIVISGLGVVILSQISAAQPPSPGPFKYIGAKAGCKMCHNTPAQGKQYDIWLASRHATAYATLATAEAKKIAQSKGINDPQKSEKCLKCHVTGYGLPKERFMATYSAEEGVSCESCHGPGEKYKPNNVMKNRKLALENGLVIPDEKTCRSCHNSESPTLKEFNYSEALKLIAHPKPKG